MPKLKKTYHVVSKRFFDTWDLPEFPHSHSRHYKLRRAWLAQKRLYKTGLRNTRIMSSCDNGISFRHLDDSEIIDAGLIPVVD